MQEKDPREKKAREKRVDSLYAYTCNARARGRLSCGKNREREIGDKSDGDFERSRIRGGQIDKRLTRISERRGHLTNEHTDTVPTIHPTIASLDSLIYVY